MGTLDDAIREHLELKRRKGASEEEIERKESEAFGRGQTPRPVQEPSPEDLGAAPPETGSPGDTELSHIGGQNGASSMQDATAHDVGQTAQAAGADDEQGEPDEVLPADSLEAELPPTSEPPVPELARSDEPPPPVPEVHRGKRDDAAEAWNDQDKPDEDEDVLEETPEFLEDTPEHDRLWFEQRPPKDFDFD